MSGAPAIADTLRVTLAAPEGGSVAEGSEGSFEVSVAGSTADGAVTVRYSVSGTATAGTDYRALSGEVTVTQGKNSARIVLSALDDDILDPGETVMLALTGASGAAAAVVDPAPATATIADLGTVTVEITPMNDTLPEGTAWKSTVTLSSAVAERVSVGWRTSDGTAVAGSDYEGMRGSVVFEPGERSKPISVKTMEDDESEPVEMFYVALDPAVAAAAASGAGAWAGNGLRIDPQQRFGFIECTVEFLDGRIDRAVDENKPKGTPVGAPVAAPTESIAYYELRGGSGRFSINDLTGQIETTEPLDHEKRSAYVVTVSVHDDCGASDTTDVTIKVNNVNEAPTADAGADQEDVESESTVTLSGTSTDLDGDDATLGTPSHEFAWVQTEGPTPRGGLKNANKAKATFTAPTVSDTTDLVFELKVTDGGDLSDTDTVTVTVLPVLKCAISVGDGDFTIPENETDVGTVDVDAENCGDLDYSVSGAGAGDVSVTAVSVTDEDAEITGSFDFEERRSYDLTLTVSERNGSERASGSVAIAVTNVNEAPTADAGADQEDVESESTVTLSGTSTDLDGDDATLGTPSHEFAWVQTEGPTPRGGLKNANKAKATFTAPTVSDTTDLVFELKVTDGGDLSDTDTVTVTVLPVLKCAISVGDGDFTIPENETDVGTVDVDAENCGDLDYSVSGAGAGDVSVTAVSVSDEDAKIKGSFDYEDRKSYDLTLTVSERNGSVTASGSLAIQVTDVPPPDRPAAPTVTGGKKQVSVTWRVPADRGSAITGYDLRYRVSTASRWTEVSLGTTSTSRTVRNLSPATTYEVQVRGVSGEGAGAWSPSGEGTTAEPDNQPPEADAGSDQTVYEGERVDLDGSDSSDEDGTIEDYAWTQRSGPSVTLYNADTEAPHFWAPTVTSTTRLRFRLTVEDDDGATDTDDVTITVVPVPVCAITSVGDGTFTVGENATTVGTVGVRANDCGALDYALTGAGASDVSAAAVSASNDNAAITGSFNFEVRSSYDLTLTVSERGGSASRTGRVRISVTDVNEAPRASGAIGRQRVRIGQPVSVDVTRYFTDEDAGDRLTFTSQSSATGRLTVNASGSPVQLAGVSEGSATVTVTARDRGGLTATQTIPVTVLPRATTPCGITVSDGALSVPEDAGAGTGLGGAVAVTTSGDCGTLSYALTGTGSGDFSVAAVGTSDDDAKIGVAGTLDHETRASYALTLTVSSGTVSAVGAVAISVTDVNEAPEVASAIPDSGVAQGDSAAVAVSPHFSDPDGDALTYSASSSNGNFVTVRASRDTVWVRGVAEGSADVTVTAEDPDGLSISQDFRVTVSRGNAAPEVVSAIPGVTVNAGDSTVVDVSGHFRDTDGDALTYEAESSNAAAATVRVSGSEVKVTGVFRGASQVTVTARDAGGLAVSQAFSVTVPNGAPLPVGAIPALTVAKGDTGSVSVSDRFTDPEGDALTYAATSSDGDVLSVAMSEDRVRYEALKDGTAKVTVTANDGHGGTADLSSASKSRPTIARRWRRARFRH
ncbi:MAG: cadherin domain-containing protein [Chloroflexota bacterium]|nr:cadherin domain-containing protein [Chloroflexota bacterium]